MSKHIKNISGQRFGRLTALRMVGLSKWGTAIWECKCDCGKTHTATGLALRSGHSKSCGCLKLNSPIVTATNRRRLMTHGMTKTLTGQSWMGMLTRCYNSNAKAFKDYGGRGIEVCEFLRATPLNLVLLIAERPSSKISLDRIDVNGHYSCGHCAECLSKGWNLNVRWADRIEQASNTTRTVLYSIHGETRCAAEWARRTKTPVNTFRRRFDSALVRTT